MLLAAAVAELEPQQSPAPHEQQQQQVNFQNGLPRSIVFRNCRFPMIKALINLLLCHFRQSMANGGNIFILYASGGVLLAAGDLAKVKSSRIVVQQCIPS